MKRDFYEILGVARDADGDTIKKAYRKLAMQFHPDKNPGDKAAEDKFKECARAYEVLSNAELRGRYDRFGHQGVDGPAGGGGPHFQDVGDIFAAFGDIFGDIFGGGMRGGQQRTRNGPRRGADLRYVMEIDLNEVITGVERPITFESEDSCETCEGSGSSDGKVDTCGTCGGRGQVVRSQGFFQMATTCPKCRGTGAEIKNPCKKCKGGGRVAVQRKILVKVPPGVDSGTQLRMTGEGEGGGKGGPPGDLYIDLRVADDPRFERDGSNLIGEIEVSYLQAILGADVEVETLRGKRTVSIPKACQYGQQVKLNGEGLPSLRGARVGDLIYLVRVAIPKKLTKEEEKLLRQIADSKDEKLSPEKGGFLGAW